MSTSSVLLGFVHYYETLVFQDANRLKSNSRPYDQDSSLSYSETSLLRKLIESFWLHLWFLVTLVATHSMIRGFCGIFIQSNNCLVKIS
ncbi:hypothetical protein GALMADRAFT_241506 [Galerina marginata CBS 339.88]|uniref:Uncharacterized protein n=1 Tax=Galerina marginata (strain CBS 339.88) TaxID=685588 RepID=A0A067TCV5_GALM3|nr:hypothetical protein GALMADRAFT_241506 [Galerina marginata CBS 339.88]